MEASPRVEIKKPTEHTLALRRCVIRNGYLSAKGDSEVLTLKQAIARLAPSKTRKALNAVLRVRSGQYIGTLDRKIPGVAPTNFVIVNPTRDGDIRWLLHKNPEFGSMVKEVYLVEEVVVPKEVVDLPGDPERI
jgi:hypothetical protein